MDLTLFFIIVGMVVLHIGVYIVAVMWMDK